MEQQNSMNIQWYPGHMTKTKRMISAEIKNMDAVCEIVDARIPLSSRNPDVDELTAGKPRLIVLNRADQADPAETRRWVLSGLKSLPPLPGRTEKKLRWIDSW